MLASYAKVPGGNLEHLGALTYPVRNPDDQSILGSRVALLPTALDAGRQQLGRIIRPS